MKASSDMVFVKVATTKVNYVFEINNKDFFHHCRLNMIQTLSDEEIKEGNKFKSIYS